MAEVDTRKVDAVLRRIVREYGMSTDDEDVLWDGIVDVIRSEDDKALERFAKAFGHAGLNKAKVWGYYAEA